MIDTQPIEEQIDARFRVKNPAPGDPGHNEGKRVGKEKDISEYRETDESAIEKEGEQKTDSNRYRIEQGSKYKDVAEVGMPAGHREHLSVGGPPRVAQTQINPQRTPMGQGDPHGDQDKNVDKSHDSRHRRHQYQRRQNALGGKLLGGRLGRHRTSRRNQPVSDSHAERQVKWLISPACAEGIYFVDSDSFAACTSALAKLSTFLSTINAVTASFSAC